MAREGGREGGREVRRQLGMAVIMKSLLASPPIKRTSFPPLRRWPRTSPRPLRPSSLPALPHPPWPLLRARRGGPGGGDAVGREGR